MACVIAMTPALMRFDWGSDTAIPELLGMGPDGGPYAEAWWGAHSFAPSATTEGPLDEVVGRDPTAALGADVAGTFGELPYLLKVLAIARPLSIQVHPTMERARQGFAAESEGGVQLADPSRIYKDASHKPEMLLAVTPMTVLSAFRPEAELAEDLARLGGDDAAHLAATLAAGGTSAYVTEVLTSDHADAVSRLASGAAGEGASAVIARDALVHYPHDPGALVALAMNAVTLAPGESLFTPAGIVHCYIDGVGVEIMANSDNVVRAGLTHKAINTDLLRELAVLEPTEPELPREAVSGAVRHLSTDATEFALSVVTDGSASIAAGPRIVLCLDGAATLQTGSESLRVPRGQAVFVAASEGEVTITAWGTAVVASVPGAPH